MIKLVKAVTEDLKDEMVIELVGNYIHVPTNEHMIEDSVDGSGKLENIWFAGFVVGYEITHLTYDFTKQEFCEPFKVHNIIMKDGKGYMLSLTKCEIRIISEEDFEQMVADVYAKAAVEKEIEDPKNVIELSQNKLLLPGVDF